MNVLKWELIDLEPRRPGERRDLRAQSAANSFLSLLPDLESFWKQIATEVMPVESPRPASEWNALLIHLEPMNGQIYSQVAFMPMKRHTCRLSVMLQVPWLEEPYYALPDAEDSTFDRKYNDLHAKVLDAVRLTLKSSGVSPELLRYQANHAFKILAMNHADFETAVELSLT